MNHRSGSIKLTAEYFKIVLVQVQNKFLSKHKIKKLPKTFQFYGYGSFDASKPNLKADFESIGTQFINGKYLYDKSRDIEKGKFFVKLNEYYKSILLLYIGYESFNDFFKEHNISDQENKNQRALIQEDNQDATYYYINYYFGEGEIILKGQTIITHNWKKIQHIFLYPLDDGTYGKHYSQGTVVKQGDTIYIKTKTLSSGRYIDGASEIYYVGHQASPSLKYLVGTYCNFDEYSNPVAGRAILEKCDNKEDMEEKTKDNIIPPYIAQEIRNKRIVNKNSTPKHYLELSEKSPFSSIYGKIPGTYELKFQLNKNLSESLKFKILSNNYKIITLTDNVYIENDRIELINKGSVINLRFSFSGIITLERVNIYFKTYYLKDKKGTQEGVFSGVDNENRLINGTLVVNYTQN